MDNEKLQRELSKQDFMVLEMDGGFCWVSCDDEGEGEGEIFPTFWEAFQDCVDHHLMNVDFLVEEEEETQKNNND